MRWWDEDRIEDGDSAITGPLLLQRSKPVTDEEARRFEEICHAATAGPLVADDCSEGGGVVIAHLPDGRSIVCESDDAVAWPDAAETAQANAELICCARSMVLRLLRDRREWKRREQGLRKRIDFLEAEIERQIERQQETAGSARWHESARLPARPR